MSKKQKKTEPKQKEFVPAPFKALKGLKVQEPSPAVKEPVKPPPEKPAVTVSDADLFLREMAGVCPVDGAKQGRGAKAAPKKDIAAAVARIDEAEKRTFLDALEGLQLDVKFEEDLPDESDPLKPLSASRMRQLKRGDIRIDLELDLHGLTREEALQSLERFVAGAYNRGQKAVLVITGKGNNSPAEPVLVGAVTSWLRDKGRAVVAEFSPAPRDRGGSGAFVVFLRDREKSPPKKERE